MIGRIFVISVLYSELIIWFLIKIESFVNDTMQKLCLNDNCYNITKQLSKKLEFLYHANRYIEDAKNAGDSQAEKAWTMIRTDEQKHADMLHELLASEVKNNRF